MEIILDNFVCWLLGINPTNLGVIKTEIIYQNNMGLKSRLLRRNIFGTLLKSPTSPPLLGGGGARGGLGGVRGGLTSDF
ncbi:MAG: hypothetical protein F6K25_01765 [Okeania sp. SIO2G4]|uniref:hypothetical protein n=1 Tax=unclassified Okeania TaxID=2634635 RepID=UPI0013BCD571|nr:MULTISPECIES: hypothetical protein [unclassified Okeania]NEP03815.1 hypothetical protein [Okeania sp. SIO4D6]NEP71616.1 hypothetical protein [Okeania sp. SIO2G5]NEP91712.1 hypothetical protein [Okeania sp. SIO2F5]NEQ89539.1 hypothetical protein [Okeania sp. SIO2G4]